jgi:glutathione synthase/RimK-type ligase-like ATP-grasp enzyme
MRLKIMEIVLLVDYRGRFGSKRKEKSFRSGFDLDALISYFELNKLSVIVLKYHEVNYRDNWQGRVVVYSSAEDSRGLYKSYIEDVVYGLSLAGALVIPDFRYLRAHNNKVGMEILRDVLFPDDRISSIALGNREELLSIMETIRYPVVLKSYEGAVSRNVRICNSKKSLLGESAILMRTPDIKFEIKELYRSFKRHPYKPESRYRKKAVVQNMIEGLNNDWKILVFGNKYYKLKRFNRVGDPRASGSGNFVFDKDIDSEILNYARSCYEKFNVPVASLDIARDSNGPVLIEFQFVTFGTKTLEDSDHYYKFIDDKWVIVSEKAILEREFAKSYSDYINRLYLRKNLNKHREETK